MASHLCGSFFVMEHEGGIACKSSLTQNAYNTFKQPFSFLELTGFSYNVFFTDSLFLSDLWFKEKWKTIIETKKAVSQKDMNSKRIWIATCASDLLCHLEQIIYPPVCACLWMWKWTLIFIKTALQIQGHLKMIRSLSSLERESSVVRRRATEKLASPIQAELVLKAALV